MHIYGIDISPQAVQLSRDNVQSNMAAQRLAPPNTPSQTLTFSEGDIFSSFSFSSSSSSRWWNSSSREDGGCDVLICNPPYISTWGFTHQTERSVRKYEPKLAQVPMITYPGDHEPEDVFYARLLDIGARRRASVMLFEVGDLAQALRVVRMALKHQELKSKWRTVRVEIWRDWPDAAPLENEATSSVVEAGKESIELKIRGSGHGRSVFMQCS